VSRDERNEYGGITVDRASRILDALGVELRSIFPAASDSAPAWDDEETRDENAAALITASAFMRPLKCNRWTTSIACRRCRMGASVDGRCGWGASFGLLELAG
jgi:hypothetical protein